MLKRFLAGGVNQYFLGQIDNPGAAILVREACASTCNHCGRITEYPSERVRMDYVEICYGCMRFICLGCWGLMKAGRQGCVPQEKECERIENEMRLRGRLTRAAWGCY